LPVESAGQRETAECLLSQITYWAKPASFNVSVTLQKVLFDDNADGSTSGHADFALWLPNGKRIFIVTAPTDEVSSSRVDRNERISRLKLLPLVVAVIEHHVGDGQPLKFAKLLSAILSRNVS